MGYRLHATILNVPSYQDTIELGKQYDHKWDMFNYKWFGVDRDDGNICHEDIAEFFDELVEINKQPGEYELYNLERLKEMVDYCIENEFYVTFMSY